MKMKERLKLFFSQWEVFDAGTFGRKVKQKLKYSSSFMRLKCHW